MGRLRKAVIFLTNFLGSGADTSVTKRLRKPWDFVQCPGRVGSEPHHGLLLQVLRDGAGDLPAFFHEMQGCGRKHKAMSSLTSA